MTDRDILRDAKIEAILREFVSEPIDHERNMARKIWAAASEAGAVPALTPSPGLRRAYQEVFNGAAPPAQPEKQAALAVGRVRHFQYSGIARNGFSQEPELFDGAPILPDGALLYAYPPTPSQQAGADAPTRLMQWHDGAGLLWDVYAFGKWLHRVVSPLNWDAHAVYLDLQRAGYASHIDVQLVSPSNTAAPAAQGDELSGNPGELNQQPSGNSGELDAQGGKGVVKRHTLQSHMQGDDRAVLSTVRFLDSGIVQMDRSDYDALSRQPSAAASVGNVKLSEGDTVYYGDQVSGASLRYHSRDQIIEYANACVLADRQKRAQDGAKLCEHLRFAVTVLEENRQRIGYVPGSPIDVRVREARAALAAAKPEGQK